jgi:hypothetical protein
LFRVFNPVLFLRRLYRFCVGLIILYFLHSIWSWLSDYIANFREFIRIERGIWRGDAKCIKKRELDEALSNSHSYIEWKQSAQQLDELEQERMIWKRENTSLDFQWKRT